MTSLKEAVAKQERASAVAAQMVDVGDLQTAQAVHRLIDHAADMGASDLCLMADESAYRISVRHLGILRPIGLVSQDRGRAFLQHIKAHAGMDVAEHRHPADGRWIYEPEDELERGRAIARPVREMNLQAQAGTPAVPAPPDADASGVADPDADTDATIDLRISTIPTLHGQDMVIRLLSRAHGLFKLEELGFLPNELAIYRRMIESPSGLVLCTGPTASGKTATLYATLQSLNDGKRKINTIEDPIEFAVEGLRQSQISPSIHVHFHTLLRSVLRQAPDVIMLGEIRDEETAATAVRAANSGHLVLSTLHAPTASSAIQSMLALGVPPHFLASALRGVVTQRLIRTLNPKTRVAIGEPPPGFFDAITKHLDGEPPEQFYGPDPALGPEAYHGRKAVFEVLDVSPTIRAMIAEGQTMSSIQQQAIDEGMQQVRVNALLELARGRTSLEEVIRVIPADQLGFGAEVNGKPPAV